MHNTVSTMFGNFYALGTPSDTGEWNAGIKNWTMHIFPFSYQSGLTPQVITSFNIFKHYRKKIKIAQ